MVVAFKLDRTHAVGFADLGLPPGCPAGHPGSKHISQGRIVRGHIVRASVILTDTFNSIRVTIKQGKRYSRED